MSSWLGYVKDMLEFKTCSVMLCHATIITLTKAVAADLLCMDRSHWLQFQPLDCTISCSLTWSMQSLGKALG